MIEAQLRVAFVASNGTHVRMFAGVADVLERRGWSIVFVDLDDFYRLGAREAAARMDRATTRVTRPGGQLSRPFYRRSALAIWGDVMRVRPIVRGLLAEIRPAIVVLGNDRGVLERLVIAHGHAAGVRSVLVQDGALALTPLREGSTRRRLLRVARRTASHLLRRIGLGAFAAVDYGQGGTDFVCATGDHGRRVFLRRGVSPAKIMVTGQPRYDTLTSVAYEAHREAVTWFTTPFLEQGLGGPESEAQEAFVSEVAEALRARAVPFIVRPHPAENPARYRAGPWAVSVADRDPIAYVLARTRLAVVGISTVTEEAALAGVPVIVPGRRVHGSRFDALLPASHIYPRFESAAELVDLLTAAPRWLAAQQAEVGRRVSVAPGDSAARRVASVIEAAASS